MTKKQALEQSVKVLGNDADYDCIVEEAMAIFAGAFAEWVDEKDWLSWNNEGQILWCRKYDEDTKNYTTSQLITEFEKIENK